VDFIGLVLSLMYNVSAGAAASLFAQELHRWAGEKTVRDLLLEAFYQAVKDVQNQIRTGSLRWAEGELPERIRFDKKLFAAALDDRSALRVASFDMSELAALPALQDAIVVEPEQVSNTVRVRVVGAIVEVASSRFTERVPTAHPAFEQAAMEALRRVEVGQATLAAQQREHDDRTMVELAGIKERLPERIAETEQEAGTQGKWSKPFKDVTAEDLSPEEVRAYFIGTYTKLETVRNHRATLLEGQRGTGKTTILKYVSFEAQIGEWTEEAEGGEEEFFDDPGNSIGIYCRLPQGVFDKSDLRAIEDQAHRDRVGEDRLVAHILWWTFETMKSVVKRRSLPSSGIRRLARRAGKLIAREGLGVEDGADFAELAQGIQDECVDEANRTDRYLGSLHPGGQPLAYAPQLTMQGTLVPVLRLLKQVLGIQLPFFLLLDDFDVLEGSQQETVFAVAGDREFGLVCFKYGVMTKGKKTSHAGRNRTYRPGDDFDVVHLDWVEGGLLDQYAEAAQQIGARRLEVAKWNLGLEDLFVPWPHGQSVREQIVAAMHEEWESLPAAERRTEAKSEYVSKYGNARYFQELRKRKVAERYAGVEYITEVSSGIIRQFLEMCKAILDRAYDGGWRPDSDSSISPEIQDEEIRKYSHAFFDNLNQTSGHADELLSGDLAVTSQELARLAESLSDLFYARLHYLRHGEPEIITVAVTDEVGPQARVLLDVAVRESILHEFTYPPKTASGSRVPAYMLNRRLTPRRNLSPRRMQGRIEVTSEDVLLGTRNREAFVAKFMPTPPTPGSDQETLLMGEGR